MLIRSKNKRNLFNINEISKIGFNQCEYIEPLYKYQIYILVNEKEYLLGGYSTEDKAIKVLDMIQEKYLEPTYIDDLGSGEYAKYERVVFQMPNEDEIE